MVDSHYESKRITRTQDSGSYSGDFDKIDAQFKYEVHPETIARSMDAWAALSKLMGESQGPGIEAAASSLEEFWESDASKDAQEHLRLAEATARSLADTSFQMTRAMDYASNYAAWYQENRPGDGYVQTGGDHERALDHMINYLNRLNEVIGYNVPTHVRTELANSGVAPPPDMTNPSVSGPGPGPAGPGPMPGPGPLDKLPTSTLSDPTFDPQDPTDSPRPGDPTDGLPDRDDPRTIPTREYPDRDPISRTPGTSLDSGSTLAGIGPGSGIAGPGSGIGGPGGGIGGPGGGLGAGGGLSAGGAAPAGGIGAGGAGRGGLGMGPAGAGMSGRGVGPGMAPMMGGRQGGEGDENERQTWLVEDDDVWGGDDVPPDLG